MMQAYRGEVAAKKQREAEQAGKVASLEGKVEKMEAKVEVSTSAFIRHIIQNSIHVESFSPCPCLLVSLHS